MNEQPDNNNDSNTLDIAIVGMSGRFPGANNLDEFWQNLCNGVETISFFSDEELKASGVSPAEFEQPNYVRAGPVLNDIDLFDADFFGYSPLEAKAMDPQQRFLLEGVWEALEQAGYAPSKHPEPIGVFVGTRMSSYIVGLYANREFSQPQNQLLMLLGNDISSLSTRVSYKLNLQGPSYALHTGCSTSLVAVHVACQSLLMGECRLAVAGGVTINVPHKIGYHYEAGSMMSPDGHCRSFDAQAGGTVFGSGMGVAVLKRLEDAVADGDTIYAVIKGSATNNDGSFKASFTAPSVEGQTAVIIDALASSGIDPETISYLEAHATATPLGDPIEVRATTNAYRASTRKKGFCRIGTVKSNLGHLDVAAGMAGLLKTTLALKHRLIPPTLNFESPNPEIDFENSPFIVNTELTKWETTGQPRRAGVNSFGFGGTNAHVILEEAPVVELSGPSRPWQLVLLSARTPTALDKATQNLAGWLGQARDVSLADVAYTLQVGRHDFARRRMLVCQTAAEAASALEAMDPQRVLTNERESGERPVVWMFTGQGAQYVNMGLELYQTEPGFRAEVDRCSELLKPLLGLDLRHVIYPPAGEEVAASSKLEQTALTQPALFVIEYALAQLWLSWGVKPQAMIGHSIGEYVAACLAGVFTLEDGLKLVAARGRLMQTLPGGAMLSVPLAEEEIRPLLTDQLALAAINGPKLTVISGPSEAIEQLEALLLAQGTTSHRLHTSHAFHSTMMDPIIAPFIDVFKQIRLQSPKLPFISNLSGTWITDEQATSPDYWAQHLRQPVRFADGVREITWEANKILLEVGPGRTLTTLARQGLPQDATTLVLNSMRHPQDEQSDVAFLLTSLGKLWLAGLKIDWAGFSAQERRYRVALPTYPFERQSYWAQGDAGALGPASQQYALDKNLELTDWFYLPTWKGSLQPDPWQFAQGATAENWLVFADSNNLGDQLVQRLQHAGQDVIKVLAGKQFSKQDDGTYTLQPQRPEDYLSLLAELRTSNRFPNKIIHLWTITPDDQSDSGEEAFEQAQARGVYSLTFLAQALGAEGLTAPIEIGVASNQLHDVTGQEQLRPEKATVLGPCRVIYREYPQIRVRNIDFVIPQMNLEVADQVIDHILSEMYVESDAAIIAYRNSRRWVQAVEPIRLKEPTGATSRLREQGTYLITGGMGGVGLVLAEYLARTVRARLILVGRSAFPAREEWAGWLATHDTTDTTSRRIHQLQSLEELGAEVLVVQADVASPEQMQMVVSQGVKQFGAIHGVIHAAGIPGGGLIQLKTAETLQSVLAPKTLGVLALEAACREQPLDFLVLCSSLTAMVGEFGQSDYAAANAFLDAFAHAQAARGGVFTVAINWDSWKEVGMAVNTEIPPELKLIHDQVMQGGLLSKEGIQVFEYTLAQSTAPQILVSTKDLPTRIKSIHELTRTMVLEAQEQAQALANRTGYARPELATAYVAPRNEFEQNVAMIWQQVLGIEQVGIHDSFFDLGGHSLLITQLMNKMHRIYQVGISMQGLFDKPTVAGMAELIEQAYIEKANNPEKPIKELLREVVPSEQQSLLEAYWKKKMAYILKIEVSQLPANGSLAEYDLNAIIGDVQWNFEQDFGLQVYPHETVKLHSLEEMARFTASELKRLYALKHNKVTAPRSIYDEYESRSQLEQRVKRPPAIRPSVRKNTPLVFSHSCVRSGSTLFRVMLAGHHKLYAPPELGILWYDTLRDWRRGLTDPNYGHGFSWAAQGLQWGFMELLGLDPDATRAYMDELVEQDTPVYDVYARLQELAAPRILVDKSPSYSMGVETLQRAEEFFDGPKYIHLVRHPYSVIESVVRIRLDKLFTPVIYGSDSDDLDPYVVAEKVWTTSNRNILTFLQGVDPARHMRVYYENLVSRPEETMRGVCDFLEIPYDPAVIQPYDNKRERMISGMGDPNILKHDQVDAKLGETWRRVKLAWQLGEPAQRLAAELEYELPAEAEVDANDIASTDQNQAVEDAEKIARLIQSVKNLSPDEVKAMLEEMGGNTK